MTKNSCPKYKKSKNVLEILVSKPLSPQQPRPHSFSLKTWVGPNPFFEEKPWGRGWSPQEAYIWRGDLTEAFLRYEFGGAYIWRGVYKEGLIFGILRYQIFSHFSGPGEKSYVLFSAKKPGENKLKYGQK